MLLFFSCAGHDKEIKRGCGQRCNSHRLLRHDSIEVKCKTLFSLVCLAAVHLRLEDRRQVRLYTNLVVRVEISFVH